MLGEELRAVEATGQRLLKDPLVSTCYSCGLAVIWLIPQS